MSELPELPRIHVVKDQHVEEGYQYQVFVGRKNGEIVCLALSRYGELTIPMLLLEVDSEFTSSTVFADVYTVVGFGAHIIVQFWSKKCDYCYDEEPFGPYMNDLTEEAWKQVLGLPVSFYPFGGVANYPERYPGFPKRVLTPK